MHHKRKRPKNRRAGCLLCKPWKASGAKRLKTNRPRALRRADEAARWGAVVLLVTFAVSACSRDQSPDSTPATPDSTVQSLSLLAGVDLKQPLRALGTEPFWSVEITQDSLVYTAIDTPELRAVNPGPVVRDSVATYESKAGNGTPMVVTLISGECSDGMSDRVYPLRAHVTLGGTTLQGCAASQAFLDTTPAP